jgi:Protein of unknown function (DUF2510)
MAPRPFSRHQKESAEESASNETNVVAQFFADFPRSDDPPAVADGGAQPNAMPSEQVPSEPVPSVVLEDHAGAGWYPDATDPGLMRYWDGFHLTGQVMHVHARQGEARPDAAAPATARVGAPLSVVESPDVDETPDVDESPDVDDSSTGSAIRATDLLAPTPSHPARSAFPPPPPAGADPAAGAQPAVITSLDFKRTGPERQVEPNEAFAAVRGIGLADAESNETERDERRGGLVSGATETADRGGHDATAPATPSSGRASSQAAEDQAGHWAEETGRAVAEARALGTSQAWQEASRIAVVVSELARTMQSATDAAQEAARLDQVAREAAQRADVAAQKASNANLSVEQASKAADAAAEEARVAEQKATEARQAAAAARQTAEEMAQAAPKFAEEARMAAEAATRAEQKRQGLEKIVARASTANTPAAWTEALKLSSEAMGSDPVGSSPWVKPVS